MKLLASISLLFAALLNVHAQGYIVPDGVLYGGYQPPVGYKVSVMHDPDNLNPLYSPYTQFWLNPVGKSQPSGPTNVFAFSGLADIQVRVFQVSLNDPVSLEPIMAQTYTELTYNLTGTYVFESGVPFYLGLYTGSNFAPPYPPSPPLFYTHPVFGWVELVNNNGVIEMLDSALVYKADGIYAGTLTLIPEPSAFAVAALGASILGFRWRKARTQPGRRVFANQIEIESGKPSCPSVPALLAGPVKAAGSFALSS